MAIRTGQTKEQALKLKKNATTAYGDTIADQTLRILDAHEIIKAKAIAMGLKIKAGEGDSNLSGTSALTLADTHKIMDTASAIDLITINPTVTAGSGALGTSNTGSVTVTVPVGYYTSQVDKVVDLSITNAGTTAITGSHTAGAASITVNGTKISSAGYITTAANANKTINLTASSKTANPLTKGTVDKTESGVTKTYLTFTPALGFYTKDAWTTDIVQYTGAKEVPITILENLNEGTLYIEATSLPEGYYTSATILPVISVTTNNKVVNVETTKPATGAGTVTPTSGYDYLKLVTVPAAVGNNNSTTGKYTITTAGWINAGDYGGLTAGSHTVTDVAAYSSSTAYTVGTYVSNSSKIYKCIQAGTGKAVTETAYWQEVSASPTPINLQYITDEIIAGYITSGVQGFKVKAGAHSHPIKTLKQYTNLTAYAVGDIIIYNGSHYYCKKAQAATVNSATPSTTYWTSYTPTVLTSQYFWDAITTSGWLGATTARYKVLDASGFSITNATNNVTIGTKAGDATNGYYYPLTNSLTATASTAGWFSSDSDTDVTVGRIAAGTHTIAAPKIATGAITGTTIVKDDYYIECKVTAGYQPASTTYIDLGPAGPSVIGRDETVTAVYFPTSPTVHAVAGRLSDSSNANSNITSSSNSPDVSTVKLGGLSGDTTFYATNYEGKKRFFTSFRVDVTATINALKAI